MAKHRPRLNVFGRQLLVHRITDEGWPVALAAEAAGVSRATTYKWLRRYRDEGGPGLLDRSSRPHRSPRHLSPEAEARIIRMRVRRRFGPHRLAPLLGHPRSTIGKVLVRRGFSRLADTDKPTGVPIRYVRDRPGELVHQDHKKLGRVPLGGGHRVHGRAGHRHDGGGYDHLEVVIDDASRVACVVPVPDESGTSAARALAEAAIFFAEHGVRIERVLTDNARSYTSSRAYAGLLEDLGIRHKHTRPYRPQTNGKAERFIRTLLTEWAYARPYRSNAERLRALPRWVRHYNEQRHHTALEGRTPMAVLVNKVRGNYN
jgi:transposase InsO family protein